jgi:hypothetical protein
LLIAKCAENRLPVEKLATQQKPFELYRPATELSRVAENANKLQKYFINVADLSQNSEFLFCQFIVDPASPVMYI